MDYVQGDPYAAPSNFRVRIDMDRAAFPRDLCSNDARSRALEDYLTRRMAQKMDELADGHRGSGKSGMMRMVDFGQAVLDRTVMYVKTGFIEARFSVGLPAKGRTVMSAVQARVMIQEELDPVIKQSLVWKNLPEQEVREHVDMVENAAWIRDQLPDRDLIAFIADDARLPRESGAGDRPMKEDVIPFVSPDSLEVEFSPPNRDKVRGMGIPEGITLIVGGGYHGKSTLLNAVAHGVYDHVPGDGREYVVTVPEAVVNRAEDGRSVSSVDISPFINNVPSGVDTQEFSTPDASGSTSQATNIMEPLEAGASALLIDEDISATNFMVRDDRMQQLVARDKEPITPLIDRIQQLYKEHDTSVIMVMGGSGDFFDVADHVIMMDAYEPKDVTDRAREISEDLPRDRDRDHLSSFGDIHHRCPDPDSINPRRGGGGKVKIKMHDAKTIQFGEDEIHLSGVHQITEKPQVRSIGSIIFHMAKEYFDGETTVRTALIRVRDELNQGNLHEMIPFHPGNYAAPRPLEVAAALNRLRSLDISRNDE